MRKYKRTKEKLKETQLEYCSYFKDRYFTPFIKKEITILHYSFNHYKSTHTTPLSYVIKTIKNRIKSLNKKEGFTNFKSEDIRFTWFREISTETDEKEGELTHFQNHHIHLLVFIPFMEFTGKKLDIRNLNLRVNDIWCKQFLNFSGLKCVNKQNKTHYDNTLNYFYGCFASLPDKGTHIVGADNKTKTEIKKLRGRKFID